MREFKLPTEVVELPSQGCLYPKDSPLSMGTLEIKYPTAREEDILSNINYIQDGSVFDRYYSSLIVSPIEISDLLIGDKNALMVAARILSYGKEYDFKYEGKKQKIDLTILKNKEINFDIFESRINNFPFHLPHLKVDITFKLLTSGDEIDIRKEIKSLKKIQGDNVGEVTTRFKYIITSVDGDDTQKNIREFVDRHFLTLDIKALRKYINQITPDVDLTFFPEGSEIKGQIPFGIEFLWPDS